LHGSGDWTLERRVLNRRKNNTTHVLGNELLKDLDLLCGVVFL